MNDELIPQELESAKQAKWRGSMADVATKYLATVAVAVAFGFILRWWLS